MNLISLKLHNFRQFYGTAPEIRFGDGKKNVTVLHGGNGAGKTAILNAFTWAFYEEHTKGFLLPAEIVCKRAIREAEKGQIVEARAEVQFSNNGIRYALTRSAQVLKASSDEWEVQDGSSAMLQYAGPDGNWHNADSVADTIGRILPKDLHTYFFFDGERIERIAQPTKADRANLAGATKKLLGVEILHRSGEHLNKVRRDLEKELQKIGDPETQELLKEKTELEEVLQSINDRNEELQRNLEGLKGTKDAIEGQLRALEEVKNLQLRRDHLNEDLESRCRSLAQNGESLKSEVSANGYAVFLLEAAEAFTGLIEDLRARGELPAGIKKQFVHDLLKQGVCICRRDLETDKTARAAVEEWMKRAGLADVEEKAIRMGGEVIKIQQMIPEFWNRLDSIQSKNEIDRTEIARIENELDEIKTRLTGSPKEEISSLQKRLSQLEEDIVDIHRGFGKCATEIKQTEQQIDDIDVKLQAHKGKEKKQRIATRRVQAAKEARRIVVEMYERLSNELRERLEKRIASIFRKISVTPYVPRLGDDYSLGLVEEAGGTPAPVAASQGESQVLSLSFIGGMVQEAREWHSKRNQLPGPAESEYPIVMDSPFGALDPANRRHVAEHINSIANQVVMLLTKTQWRDEVEQASQSRVGRSYVLTYYTPRDDFEEETIEIDGRVYDLVKRSPNEFEYTEIVEVINA